MSANRAFFVLFLLSSIALVGLATFFIKIIPMLVTHVVYICQKTFSNVIFTFSHSGPLFLIILMAIILLIGASTLAVQILKTRRYLKKNLSRKVFIPSILKLITHELNLDGKIIIIKDNNRFSFCYGLLKPRICLSTGFLRSLNTNELRAVLLHESYHVKNRDPVKIILGKTASMMFFFIPIFRDIQSFYTLSKEIAADKLVVNNGYKQPLLSVLSKLLLTPSPKFSGLAALGSIDDLEKRVLYLTGNQIKTTFKPSLLNISLSAFVVLFSLVIVNTPVYAVSDHEGSMEHSLFICPFGDKCALSCKAKEEEGINSSKELMYTPMNYTPK